MTLPIRRFVRVAIVCVLLSGCGTELEADPDGADAEVSGDTASGDVAGDVSSDAEPLDDTTADIPTNSDSDRRDGEVQVDGAEIDGQIAEVQTDATEVDGQIGEVQTDATEVDGQIAEVQTDATEVDGQNGEVQTDASDEGGPDADTHAADAEGPGDGESPGDTETSADTHEGPSEDAAGDASADVAADAGDTADADDASDGDDVAADAGDAADTDADTDDCGLCNCADITVELCNGLDDDCDQAIDEDCACLVGDTRACGVESGACTLGTQSCIDGLWGACDAVTATTEACDDVDNDCDGETDEAPDDDHDGASACLDDCDDADPGSHPDATEASDDGVDSDCDQRELFDGQALDVIGRLDADAVHTPASGTFDVAGLGPIAVTGEVTRAAAGAPATWCIGGPFTATLGELRLVDATIEVCHPGAAVAHIDGTATIYGHSVQVAGTYDRGTQDLRLDVTGRVRVVDDHLDWEVAAGSVITRTSGQLAVATTAHRTGLTLGGVALTAPVLTLTGQAPQVAGGLTLDGMAPVAQGPYAARDLTLALALAQGTSWTPATGITLADVAGTLTRRTGVVAVTLGGRGRVTVGDASFDVALQGPYEGGDIVLSGHALGPIAVATNLVTVARVDVAIDGGEVTVATAVTAPLPSGWPATTATVSGTVVAGRAVLAGPIAAPYQLGPDFVLANARLTLDANPGNARMSLGGDATLPWDPQGAPLHFVADVVPGVRPLLVARAEQRNVCGVDLTGLEVTASLDSAGKLTFGEDIDGDATITVEGVAHAMRFEGAADGMDFSLSASLGDITLMHGAAPLSAAFAEIVCEGGVATRRVRGRHALHLPDGGHTTVTMSGVLAGNGTVPTLRGALDAGDTVGVFDDGATLKAVVFEVVRGASDATFYVEGEERVTIERLTTDVAMRYRGAFAPGHEPAVLDGVPLSDDGGLTLASLQLAAVSGRLSRPGADMVREISGRYDHELPDGEILVAQLEGRISTVSDSTFRGEIRSDGEDGVYQFFEELTLERAGLEVVLSATEKSVAIYGDFELELDERVFALAVRGQFTSYSSQAAFSGKQLTLSGQLTGEGGAALVEIVPGLVDLSDVTIGVVAQKLKNSSDGNKLAITLEGRALVTLDDTPFTVVVTGELGLAQSTLTTPGTTPGGGKKRPKGLAGRLEGRIDGDVQPLRSVLGDDRAALIDPLVAFDFKLKPTPTVRLIVAADAEVCVTETCVLGSGIQMSAVGVF